MYMNGEVSLILPNIRSAHNVGAMFRTADAFGVSNIYLVGYTAVPPKPQIDKVSLGAERWVPWEKREDLLALLDELRQRDVLIIGLEKTKTSKKIETLKPVAGPIAIIVGNEVDGIDSDTLAHCDAVVHIPMRGKKESLNVSVAAGIALYAIQQKRV